MSKKYSDRKGVSNILLLITMITLLEFLRKEYPSVCPPGTLQPVWPDDIPDPNIDGVPASCEAIADLLSRSSLVYYIMLPLGVVSTAIACMSCTWGWKLTQLQYFVRPRFAHASAPFATAATTYLSPDQVVIVSGTVVDEGGAVHGLNRGGEYKDNKFVPAIV